MSIFYRPDHGVVGDCIPYYSDGRYHLFYLRDYRDAERFGWGSPWHHVSTVDGLVFEDHGEAIPKGTMDEHDPGVGTGSIFTDEDGLHYAFFTGINPSFKTPEEYSQVVLRATSTDLINWEKDPEFIFLPDESRYERHDWRDPFVYRHPVTGVPTMLLTARTRRGEASGRGCTVVLESDDLFNWTRVSEYAPGRYHGHECPDFFRMGDWYYMVFSEYTTRTATRYVMARTPDGPWRAPADSLLDTRAFYAAKSAAPASGGVRLLFGWNPTKEGDRDDGDWQWGGDLVVHEIHARSDGTLGLAPLSALTERIDDEDGNAEHPDEVELDGVSARTTQVLGRLGEGTIVDVEVEFSTEDGTAGLLIGTDHEGEAGYFLRLDATLGVVQFGRVGGYRDWYVDHFPELDRRLAVSAGQTVRIRAAVEGTVVVVYVDDVALSARAYDLGQYVGCFADGGAAIFRSIHIRELE